MRSKDEIAEVISKRLISKHLIGSTISDIVTTLNGADENRQNGLIKRLGQGRIKDAGKILHEELLKNAEIRARQEVDIMLANNTLSLTELDELV